MFDKVLSPFREFGTTTGLVYAVDRLLLRLGSTFRLIDYDLVAQPVPDCGRVPARRRAAFEVREIEPGDPALALMPVTPDILEFRFRQSAMCLGVWKKGEFLGYTWLCFQPYEEDEVRCRFVPEPDALTAWDFDVYVFPEHRLGFAFAVLWDAANEVLRGRGVRYSVSRIARANVNSLKVHDHFGLQRLGRAVFLTGRRVQVMVATVPPFVHVAFGPDRRPDVKLRVRVD